MEAAISWIVDVTSSDERERVSDERFDCSETAAICDEAEDRWSAPILILSIESLRLERIRRKVLVISFIRSAIELNESVIRPSSSLLETGSCSTCNSTS